MVISDSTKNPQDWKIFNDMIEQISKYKQESGNQIYLEIN